MRSAEFLYDGTIEGYLTVIGNCISEKMMPLHIHNEQSRKMTGGGEALRVKTDTKIADNIYRLIGRRSSPEVQQMVNDIFLTSVPDMEMDLFVMICKAIKHGAVIAEDYQDEFMKRMQFAIRDLYREAQTIQDQMSIFERDKLAYAMINPRNKVLPILENRIRKDMRYDDMIIYDKRHRMAYVRFRDESAVIDISRLYGCCDIDSAEDVYYRLWPYFTGRGGIPSDRNIQNADALTKLWYVAG